MQKSVAYAHIFEFSADKNSRVTWPSNGLGRFYTRVKLKNDVVMIFFLLPQKKRKTVETPVHCRSRCWFWEEAPYRRRPIMPALIHSHLHGRAKNTVNSRASRKKRACDQRGLLVFARSLNLRRQAKLLLQKGRGRGRGYLCIYIIMGLELNHNWPSNLYWQHACSLT